MPAAAPLRIGIAGAGLCGRLLAWRLLRRGCEALLYDRDSPAADAAAGMVAAGMIAPCSEAAEGEAQVAALGADASARWARWLRELREDSGESVSLLARGTLTVAHSADDGDWRRFRERLERRVSASGARWRELDREALAGIEEELAARFHRGIYLPEESCLDNRALFAALEKSILALGGQWNWGREATAVLPGELQFGAERKRFDCSVDCRGAGAVGAWPGLRSVRGELIDVFAPEVRLSRPVRLLHPRYRLYVVPRSQSVYTVGATEIESEARNPVTVRSALELLSALFSLHPGFAEAEIRALRVGRRSAFADNLPRLECDPGRVRINGLYRHGFLFAPRLVEEAERWICGERTTAPPTPLSAGASA